MGREKSEKQNYFCYNPYNGIAGNFEIPILQTHEKPLKQVSPNFDLFHFMTAKTNTHEASL